MDYDLKIAGGTLFDGTGADGVRGDIGIANGTVVAYAVIRNLQMDLRLIGTETGEGQLLFTWEAADVRWRWAPDSSHLFAVLPGDWDWQLWELPRHDGAPRLLVREAAGIGDLAVSPDGTRLAVVAEARLDFERERHEVFLIDRRSAAVQRFNLSGQNAHSLTWLDDQSVLMVVSDPTYPIIPSHRQLGRLDLADGSLLSFP